MNIKFSRRRFLDHQRRRARRDRDALSLPRRRPAGGHPWRAVRRRQHRQRRGLGARRPAVADAGRGGDHRDLRQCPRAAADRGAARERLHRKDAAGKPAGADRTSSIASASAISRIPTSSSEPVIGRFRTAPADRRDVSFVWGGDVAGQGWGINPMTAACSPSPPCASTAGFLPAFRRHDLCRRPDQGRGEARRRQDLEERHDSRRRPRSPRRSTNTAPRTNTISSTTICAPSMPKCRSSCSGTTTRSPTTGRRRRSCPPTYKERDITLLAARAAPRLPRDVSDAREHRRARPGLPHASTTARISTCSCSTSAAIAAPTAPNLQTELRPRQLFPRPGPARLAEARRC